MITNCSHFTTIAEVHKCLNARYHLSAVSDTELMGVIVNVQGIVIVNRHFIGLHKATDCSVTSVGHACLFAAYSYMLVLISVIVIYTQL